MQKKRYFNFRVFTLLALFAVASCLMATYLFVSKTSKLVMLFTLIGFAVVCFVIMFFKCRKLFMLIAVCFLVMAIPFASIYAKSCKYSKNEIYSNQKVLVCGKISEHYKFTNSGNLALTLDNISIAKEDEVSEIDGKVVIYTNPSNLNLGDFECGRVIIANTELSFVSLEHDIKDSLNFSSRGIVATGYSLFYDIKLTDDNDKNLRDVIRQGVYDNLESGDVNYYEIGYAMLFGDSNVLTPSVKTTFRATGIAHLIAVSGLNISIIVGIVAFILSKLKVSHKYNFIVSLILLAFYVYLCDFSISVIRASLMALLLIYSKIRGKAYDNLSVLSLIALVVLIINPLELFNISFVLSFLAVLSIILLMPPLTRFFDKYFYKTISSALALNIAVQIGLFASNIYYFGKFPLLGILANFVAVPIASVAFVVLVVGVGFSFISPIFNFINVLFGLMMDVVVRFNTWIANIGYYIRFGTCSAAVIPLMICVMFVLSDYFFISNKNKALISSVLVAVSAVMLVI